MFAYIALTVMLGSSVSAHYGGGSSSSEEYKYKNTDALSISVSNCLATKANTQSIDIVIDTAVKSYYNQQVASFVESLSRSLPATNTNIYAIIVNGTYQTRFPVPLSALSTYTPQVLYYRTGRRQQSYQPTTISGMLQAILDSRTTQLPSAKPAGAPATLYTIIITDFLQGTAVSTYQAGDNSIIFDLNGNLANASKGYRTRNLKLPRSLQDFTRTVLYEICQAAGGIAA